MKKAHVTIYGFVQGVGFRHFVRKMAQDLGIFGWVRNTPNGCVEALFQGDDETIEKILKQCKKGPFLSEVEDMTINWVDDEETYREFRII